MAVQRYGRRSVETSNETKLLFPAAGLTKGELIDYYQSIADLLLPHLRERPLVLQRFPDGIEATGFYQKQVGDHFPDWVGRARVPLRGGGHQELTVCNDRATLAFLADQACITLHPWLSRREDPDRPDRLVIDLDPPEGDFEGARRAALRVRALLEGELGLVSFPMLTGSKGVHAVVPLDRRAGFDQVRAFAREAMALLAARHPRELTTAHRKAARGGRVYLDTGRNAYGQTAVAPWSVRALPEAPLAAPLDWAQLERTGLGPREVTVRNVFRRLDRRGDPWAGWRRRARSLDRACEALSALAAEG